MKRFYEKGLLDISWVQEYCRGNWKECERYKMEEAGKAHPDNMLPDGTIDENLS